MCGDMSDIQACNQEMTCFSIGGNFSSVVSTITSELVDGHSFCIQSNDRNDGGYDAISREDEDNLDIVSTSTISLDYSKLGHCNTSAGDIDSAGNPGIKCGTRCMPSYGWCELGTSDPCDDGIQVFTTNNPGLCRNSTFWREVSCTTHYSSGIAAMGLRCLGTLQGCINPWYLSNNYYYEAGFMVMRLIIYLISS